MAGIVIEIPEAVAASMQLSPDEAAAEMKKELAVALYSRRVLSIGKASELAEMTYWDFDELLADRGVERQYDARDLADDIAHGRGRK